jgi:hypothetical protein
MEKPAGPQLYAGAAGNATLTPTYGGEFAIWDLLYTQFMAVLDNS